MDVGTSVYGPKFRIRRYPADRYRPTASCWRTPVSRINRRIPFSTAMASSAATTCRDSPRRRHSERTYIRLSSPNPSPYFIPSRSAPQPTTSPVSYTHLRAHETDSYLVCRLLLEKKKLEISNMQTLT